MSDHPGEGYTYRYSQLLKRLLEAKGGEPIPELAQELVAALILENDRAEYGHLADEEIASADLTIAAGGAGNRSQIGVGNPAGSGILVVVEAITNVFQNGAAGPLTVRGMAMSVAHTDTKGTFRDSRKRSFTSGVTGANVISKNNAGVSGNALFRITQLTTIYSRNGLLVISPGFGVWLDTGTDNQSLDASIHWRERALEQAETG